MSLRKAFIAILCIAAALTGSAQVAFQANNTDGCTPMGVVISVTSPTSGISSYLWQITTPGGNVLSSSSPQYIAIFSQPGDYDVTLTINGNQTATINNYISVHALPVANFTLNDPSGCFPLCVDFSDLSVIGEGAIVEWSWDFGDGGSSTEQNPEYCYNAIGTYTPVFSVEDEYGCYADITMPGMISVSNNFPNAAFTASAQLTCNPPVDISFSNASTGNSALSSVWDFGDGSQQSTTGTAPVTHTFNNTGTFDVCMTVSNSTGCTDELCTEVTIFDTATAAFTISDASICEGETITFSSTTIPQPTSITWDFNGDGTADSSLDNTTFAFNEAGTYSPALTVQYGPGCQDTQTHPNEISVVEGIDVDFLGDTLASCSFPFTVSFTNLSTGPGTISYEWFVNNTSVGTSTDLTYTFNNYGQFDIKLIATNSAGCANELTLNDYVIVQEPTVEFDNGSSVCTDQNVPVFNVQVTSVDPVAFYFWDFNSDGTTDAEGLMPLFMYDAPGVYSITLTIETITGCTAVYTSTQNINVLMQVDATFSSSADTTCAGQPVEFCVDNQPGNTYTWNFYDGSGWIVMPLSENCIIHDYADTGWYDLTLTVFNGACNVLQTFENFIYVEPPVALFEYQVVCGNLSADFADISIGADSIVWDFGDGTILSNVTNPSHQYDTAGVYTIMLTAYANGSDCPDVTSAEITVSDPEPIMHFTPEAGCPPLVSEFTSEFAYPVWDVSVSNGDHIFVQWLTDMEEWEITHTSEGETQVYTSENPHDIDWPQVLFYDGGFYDVSATVTDENGCSATVLYPDAVHVSANPNFASFETTALDLCNTVNISFAPDLPDLVSWQWIFSDGFVSTSENPVHTFNPPYNYNSPLSATLTATDSLGCSSQVTQQINVTLPAVVNFVAASDPSCEGDAVQFINYTNAPAGTTYFWNFGDPSSADNTSTEEEPTHVFAENGTYEVCLSADNLAGCITTECITDAVHIVNPEVNFTYTSNINNCLFGVQFNNTTPGTVVSATWNFGDNQSGVGQMSFHTYPIGVYDVTLTVINSFGCIDSLFVPDILNYGNQVGPFTQALDSANCAPFDVSLSAFNPADTYFDYFWDFNDGSGDPSGNTNTSHTYTEPGVYCPSVIMTDPNGCPVLISCTDSILVEEFVLDYTVPEYICYGDTLELLVQNATELNWQSINDITNGSNEQTFLLHPQDDATFVLTGTFADCVRTDTIHLVVRDLPIVTLVIDNELCYGDENLLLGGGAPADPPGIYTVNGDVQSFFDTQQTPDLNYEIAYTYTDSFQCVNTATETLALHALPQIEFPDFDAACENDDMILLNSATPQGGYYSFEDVVVQNLDPSIGAGAYTVSYHFTDIHGCYAADSSILVVHPIPVADIAFDTACLNTGLAIDNLSYVASGNIDAVLWNYGVAGTDDSFQPEIVFFPNTGMFPIQLTLTTNEGCINGLDTIVQIHAVPHPQFSPDVACQQTPLLFDETSTISSDSIVHWIWSAEGQTYATSGDFEYAFVGYGDIPVALTAVSNYGCRDSVTVSVAVRPAPQVSIDYNDGCLGIESLFNALVEIPYGGVVSNTWGFGDGNPQETGIAADNLYAHTGSYEVSFTAVSNMGCITAVQDTITIYPVPEPDFAVNPENMCAGEPFQMIDLSSVDVPSEISAWSWYLEGQLFSGSQNPQSSIDQPGAFDITLSVASNHGCVRDTTINNAVVIYPSPEAGFYADTEASMSDPEIDLIDESSEDVIYWYYEFGDGQGDTFESGTHVYDSPGQYQIVQYASNTFGCRDTAFATVEILPEILVHIPNAFTPDANGHNEVFKPVIFGFDVTYYEFKIFDRWGALVFSTQDPEEGWNGQVGDTMAQDGSYSWFMDIKNGKDVEIIRKFGKVILLR
jgi:gliding motility-associated-like protein